MTTAKMVSCNGTVRGSHRHDRRKDEHACLSRMLTPHTCLHVCHCRCFFTEPDRKTIDPETAYDMWQLVLSSHFSLLSDWIDFCKKKNIKTVPKDVWEQLYGRLQCA